MTNPLLEVGLLVLPSVIVTTLIPKKNTTHHFFRKSSYNQRDCESQKEFSLDFLISVSEKHN